MPWLTLFPTLAEAESRVKTNVLFTVKLPRPPFKICLVRREDGSWRAFEDNCPHKKASFSRGGFLNRNGDVVCPLHQYAFELDTGAVTSGESCPNLDVLPLEVGDEGVRIKVY